MPKLRCCCWDKDQPLSLGFLLGCWWQHTRVRGRGRSFFPCSPGQLLSLPGLGLSLLPLVYPWEVGSDGSAYPAGVGAVPGRIRCIPGLLHASHTALGSHRTPELRASTERPRMNPRVNCGALPPASAGWNRAVWEAVLRASFWAGCVLHSPFVSALEKVGKEWLKSRRKGEGQERMLKLSSAPGTSNFCVHSCPCCPFPYLPTSVRALLLTRPSSCMQICLLWVHQVWGRLDKAPHIPVLLAWDRQGLSSQSSRLLSHAKDI